MTADNLFRDKLQNTDDFLLTFELVPGRSSRAGGVEKALGFAKNAAKERLLDALTITDNPGGNPALSPDVLGTEIKQRGIDTIVHFSCRDLNRYGAFSRIMQLDRLETENLLVVTGDYPQETPEGTAKPCFDLDSVTMLCMLDGMNHGDQTFCSKNPGKLTEKTNFLLGAAVSCFKYAESEVITQYYKLLKKVHNGAEFAITQICYDARKFDELKRFLENADCNIPVIGSVCILNEKSARAMNQGNVPGAFVTQKLFNQIQSEAADKDNGKQASLIRTAKLIAILKGLGYRGAHIVGPPNYDDIREVIENFKQIQNQWRDFLDEFNYPYPGGFYLYQKDQQTGLNIPELAKKANTSVCSWTVQTAMETTHHLLFNKNAYHYSILKRIAEIVDKKPWLKTVYGFIENITKSIMFDCRMCGDCALSDMANLCPESKCPKFLRNGPCGGSSNKFCEVRKDKLCVWVRVYERLKAHKKQDQLNQICLGPRNWALDQTSSWLNFYLNRDYHLTQKPYCPRINEISG